MEPISIGTVGKLVGGFVLHLAKGQASEFVKEPLKKALRKALGLHQPSLHGVLVEAFRAASRKLAEEAPTPDERKILEQIRDVSPRLFQKPHDEAVDPVLQAIIEGDELGLRQLVAVRIKPYVAAEAVYIRADVERRLSVALVQAFGEALKEDKNKKAWIDFERSLLSGSRRQILEALQEQAAQEREDWNKVLQRLDSLAKDAVVLEHLRQANAEALAGIGRVEQSGKTLEELMRAINRRLVQDNYDGREVAARIDELVEEYTRLFAGRKAQLDELDRFVAKGQRQFMVVRAPAGMGKTALLANWVARRREAGYFTVFHSFSQRYAPASTPTNGLGNLLRQLYAYHEIDEHSLPPTDQGRRDWIYELVSRGGRSDEPLVIVVDALDEVEAPEGVHPFPPPFRFPLPAHVCVIISVRAGETQSSPFLRGWPEPEEHLYLRHLTNTGIAEWLRGTASRALVTLATDSAFVSQVAEITDRFPLYLSFLIQDLEAAVGNDQDPRAVLSTTPSKFRNYVEQQWERLAEELFLLHEVQWLFALLAVAKGPLSPRDLAKPKLTCLNEGELKGLPRSVTRWLVVTGRDGALAFAHSLLAEEFGRVAGGVATDARATLLTFCESWRNFDSIYPLHYFATHLAEAGETGRLYALARDPTFFRAQCERLPDDPDATLGTVQSALGAASGADDPGAMAEFLLLHVQRIVLLAAEESPFSAVRGRNWCRAVELAELRNPELAALWTLLISWQLKSVGDQESSKAALMRLADQDLPTLSGWQEDFAVACLSRVFDLHEQAAGTAAASLLDTYALQKLCAALARRQEAHLAILAAQRISYAEHGEDVGALVMAAEACREAGNADGARSLLAAARTLATKLRRASWFWFIRLIDVGQELGCLGDKHAACSLFAELLAGISEAKEDSRAELLERIAIAQHLGGEPEAARETFKAALSTIHEAEPIPDYSLREIARRAAALGDLGIAWDTAAQICDLDDRAIALAAIAEAQAAGGALVDAVRTAEVIPDQTEGDDQGRADDALGAIAEAQARRGDWEGARMAALVMRDNWRRDWAFYAIAEVAGRDGQAGIAREAAELIEDAGERSKALGWAAAAQAKTAGLNDAMPAFEEARAAATQVPDDDPDITGFASESRAQALLGIAEALDYIGDCEAAQATLAAILETAEPADAMIARARAFATIGELNTNHSGTPDGLPDFFDIALSAAAVIGNNEARVEVLEEITASLARAGRWDRALQVSADVEDDRLGPAGKLIAAVDSPVPMEILQEALTEANQMNEPELRALTFAHLAHVQAQRGAFQEANESIANALGSLQRDEKSAMRDAVLAKVVAAQAAMKEFGTALTNVLKIGDAEDRARALADVALAQAQAGEREAASSTLVDARLAADQAPNGDPRCAALAKVAVTYAKMGNFAGAIALAASVGEDIGGGHHAVEAFAEISVAQAEAGSTGDARATLVQAKLLVVEESLPHVRLWGDAAILHAHAVSGFYEEAVHLADSFVTNRNSFIPATMDTMVRRGDRTWFKRLLLPCAFDRNAAYLACGTLARAYPDQAHLIGLQLIEHDRTWPTGRSVAEGADGEHQAW